MASFLRRRRAKYAQSDAAQCESQADICTEDWEDYVVVTVDSRPEQPVNKHRVCSLESSLDSGYEEIHMPPPAPATSAADTEEDTAAGAGSISTNRNQGRNGEAKQVSLPSFFFLFSGGTATLFFMQIWPSNRVHKAAIFTQNCGALIFFAQTSKALIIILYPLYSRRLMKRDRFVELIVT